MSGFALRVRSQASAATEGGAERLLAAVAGRGPDRHRSGVFDSIEVAHAALHATPEASSEFFPVRHPTLPMWVVADARIDDQQRLRGELVAGSCSFNPETDADLILAAHEVWGSDAQLHLVGDFAYALWHDGVLLCARDVMGIKPLWWADIDGDLVVGSTLRSVRDELPVIPGPNEQFVAEFLLWQLSSNTNSPYEGVHRLGPGERLLCDGQSIKAELVDSLRMGPAADDDVAVAQVQVRAVLEQAVRDRLRSPGPVVCDLSGGLDSTTIFGLARTLVPDSTLHTLSEVYPGQPHDEAHYIDQVVAGVDIVEHRVNGADRAAVDLTELSASSGNVHYFVDSLRPVMQLAADSGCRVRLTGQGGDEAFSVAASFMLDRFLDRGALAALRGMFRGWGARGLVRQSASIFRQGAFAFVQDHQTLNRLTRSARAHRVAKAHPWITPTLLRKRGDVPRHDLPAGGSAHSRRERHRWYSQPTRMWSYEELDQDSAGLVETRHPFADRRFVELMLTLPNRVVNQAGAERYLHRQTFGDVLPPAILERHDKASFGQIYQAAAVKNVEPSFAALATHQMGWTTVDQPDGYSPEDLLDRWCTITVSRWLDSLHRSEVT